MNKIRLRSLAELLRLEPGIWFFGALAGMLGFGYLEVMSRLLAVS